MLRARPGVGGVAVLYVEDEVRGGGRFMQADVRPLCQAFHAVYAEYADPSGRAV